MTKQEINYDELEDIEQPKRTINAPQIEERIKECKKTPENNKMTQFLLSLGKKKCRKILLNIEADTPPFYNIKYHGEPIVCNQCQRRSKCVKKSVKLILKKKKK